ncbi:MAG: EAL domain-containing protein [Pseudomonadota bacterium]
MSVENTAKGTETATPDGPPGPTLNASQSADVLAGIPHEALVTVLDSLPDGLLILDRDDRVVAANSRLAGLFGSAASDIRIGMTMTELVEQLAIHGAQYSELPTNVIVMRDGQRQVIRMPDAGTADLPDHKRAAVRRMALHQAAPCDYEEMAPTGRWLHVSTRMTGDGGRIICYRDITERKVRERRLEHSILHDPTTGLPNTTLFRDRALQALRRCVRDRTHLFSIVLVDLAGRSATERGLPVGPGDDGLIAAARRLEHVLRPDDTVAHLQGCTFACLLDDVSDVEECREIADRVHASLREPFQVGSGEFALQPAIGIVLGSGKATDLDELLRGARVALECARYESHDGIAMFDAEMRDRTETRLRIDNDLRLALKNDELELYYQPILDLRRGHLAGFEALARWHHADLGPIPPDQFIPIAEDSDLIIPLGRWALNQAAAQIAAWTKIHDDLFVAVNISPRQFADNDLVDDIRSIIEKHGVAPEKMRLEITETFMVENPELASVSLDALRAMGLHISIDDFGAGYTSLGHLHAMPYDALKIDRSFIADMENKRGNRVIVQAITDLAHKIGMSVVAEGVETDAQRVLAEAFGCDLAQGYLLGRPVPADKAEDLVRHVNQPVAAARISE